MENKFKFEIGSFVKHITQKEGYNQKMVVVTRYIEESAHGSAENYLTSCIEMGQVIRCRFLSDELIKVE